MRDYGNLRLSMFEDFHPGLEELTLLYARIKVLLFLLLLFSILLFILLSILLLSLLLLLILLLLFLHTLHCQAQVIRDNAFYHIPSLSR